MKGSENSVRYACSQDLSLDRATLIESCTRKAESIYEIDCFKSWIRTCVRPLLPHGALACVHGRTYGVGVSLDYVVTIDYPVEHLQAIRNSSGHMDTPLARLWFEQQIPVFFDENYSSIDIPATWLGHFRKHDLRNTAADGVLDKPNCIATYFSFHQLPALNEMVLCSTFKMLTPLLHKTFTRVVRNHKEMTASVGYNYHLLTGREQEIATYISQGKSNGHIALLLGVAESTIRNHVSRILDKTGCNNRAGLATAVILEEQNRFGMGTKVL